MEEQRNLKVSFNKSGGTAGKGDGTTGEKGTGRIVRGRVFLL